MTVAALHGLNEIVPSKCQRQRQPCCFPVLTISTLLVNALSSVNDVDPGDALLAGPTYLDGMPVAVQYPGKFELKIIGTNEDGFVSDIRRVVASCLPKGDENVVSCTTREKGRYTSISLKVFVENSAQLYKVRRSSPTKYPAEAQQRRIINAPSSSGEFHCYAWCIFQSMSV